MPIRVLEAEVFNRIAAGEVVERPASIVKELVENSIDAGATAIVVEILRGGKTSIKISDNGCGIPSEELRTAFLPHATSKIASKEDLDRIATLGFRGEALASIAAVADVRVISKPAEQEIGACIELRAGEVSVSDAGCPDGTYFTVTDLFDRIPARAKFLEKDYQEEAAITDCMARLILSHPDISFRYLADGKKIYQSYGQGIRDAVRCVYGAGVLDELLSVELRRDGVCLTGFVGKDSFTKPNRTYQTLIVNGRYVTNQTVSNAVYYAYADRLMKRQFPFYVLYLTLSVEDVDVNVHPNKLDVRFVHKDAIYSLVNVAVAHVLSSHNEIPSAESAVQPTVHPVNYVSNDECVKFSDAPRGEGVKLTFRDSGVLFRETGEILQHKPLVKSTFDRERVSVPNGTAVAEDARTECTQASEAETTIKTAQSASAEVPTTQESMFGETGEGITPVAVKAIGVAFATYLIVESDGALYFVDQHAAHERLLYDTFKAQADRTEGKQALLLPYVFRVNAKESAYLLANSEAIRSIGIDIEEFGENTFRIDAVPALLTALQPSVFVKEILTDLGTDFAKSASDIGKDRLMQAACKAAVKGGDILTERELGEIMRRVAETNAVLKCPHGRPIAVRVGKEQVEKWFKRIVS